MIDLFKKLVGDKKEYRDMMARVKVLPEEYQFVFEKIRYYMWGFGAGDGMDMLQIHYELIELFELGAAEGKPVLDITGQDVATFADELLRNTNTYTQKRRIALNNEILEKIAPKNTTQ